MTRKKYDIDDYDIEYEMAEEDLNTQVVLTKHSKKLENEADYYKDFEKIQQINRDTEMIENLYFSIQHICQKNDVKEFQDVRLHDFMKLFN